MTVTAKQIYDAALVLMDEVLETGNIVPDQPEYYEAKALSLINSLQLELLPLSATPTILTSLSETVSVPDRTALLIMPYGLAAHLLIQEDGSTASFFNARYDELKRRQPTAITAITDAYGIVEGMQ